MEKKQKGLTAEEIQQETESLARDLSFHARAPVSIQLVGGQHIAYTYDADDSGKQHAVPIVMNPSILTAVRTKEQAVKIWRGIGYHELLHHLFPASAQYKIALKEGFKELFNLVDDEQNERRGRALNPAWGTCFQAVCAHIFSKKQRRREAEDGTLSTGIIDGDNQPAKPSVRGRAATKQYGRRWNDFKYHLRLHIDQVPNDPVVAEALGLIGKSFKNLSKDDLLKLTRSIHNVLCTGIELPPVPDLPGEPESKPDEDDPEENNAEDPDKEPEQTADGALSDDDKSGADEDEDGDEEESDEKKSATKSTWSPRKLLRSKIMLVPFLLFIMGWSSLLLHGSMKLWVRVAITCVLFSGSLITFLFLRRAFIKALLARITAATAAAGSASGSPPVSKSKLLWDWLRRVFLVLALAVGAFFLFKWMYRHLGEVFAEVLLGLVLLAGPPIVAWFLLKKSLEAVGTAPHLALNKWKKFGLVTVSLIGASLLLASILHDSGESHWSPYVLIALALVVLLGLGFAALIIKIIPADASTIGASGGTAVFRTMVLGSAYRSGKAMLRRGSTLALHWAIGVPLKFLWHWCIVTPLRLIWKWLVVAPAKFSWRYIITPSARFVWRQMIVPTARFIWFKVIVPAARFVWFKIIVPSARFIWSIVVAISKWIWHRVVLAWKFLMKQALRLLYLLAPRLRRMWRKPLFRLAILALPVAMLLVMIYAVMYTASKISIWLLIALIVILLILLVLGIIFRKKIKRFVVTELFIPMPSLMDYFMAVPLDMTNEWFVQIDNIVPVQADTQLAKEFLEQAVPLAQQLRAFFARCGKAETDREDQPEGYDLIDEVEQALVGETSLFIDDQSKPRTSLHLEVALDCSSSMASATRTLKPGEKFQLGKFMAFVLEQASVNLPGVSSHFWGFTDSAIYDCGTAGEGRVTGLPLGGGNNDAAMLWKMAKSAEASGKDVTILIMLSDGQPSECSWLSLHNLVLQLEQEGMIPWNFALDVISTPAFKRFFTDLVGQSPQQAVLTMTETLAQIADESSC